MCKVLEYKLTTRDSLKQLKSCSLDAPIHFKIWKRYHEVLTFSWKFRSGTYLALHCRQARQLNSTCSPWAWFSKGKPNFSSSHRYTKVSQTEAGTWTNIWALALRSLCICLLVLWLELCYKRVILCNASLLMVILLLQVASYGLKKMKGITRSCPGSLVPVRGKTWTACTSLCL